jgi:photosystem II stability/assembly factor-like uncharacterized protein
MRVLQLTLLLTASIFAAAQSPTPATNPWQMQDSGTTAGLRGIFSVDGTVAWTSGTNGTVLKTIDGGAHWTKCAVPDAAKDGATLDFRGVQAWDAETAIVMASGPGDKSRLYKTTDGCGTWKLAFKNPDKEGFWNALYFESRGDGKGRGTNGWLLGDPVGGMFSLFSTLDSGKHWFRQGNKGLHVKVGAQGAFAASNSSLFAYGMFVAFGSGGTAGAFVYSGRQTEICLDDCSPEETGLYGNKHKWNQRPVFFGKNTESSGVFSIEGRHETPIARGYPPRYKGFVAVGGDYTRPDESAGTAAWSADGGETWTASAIPPHGFRSAVQWSEAIKAWITVGTNGSDISRDDGKTWQPLDNGTWNALSLPFVVGPNGGIARMNPAALAAGK